MAIIKVKTHKALHNDDIPEAIRQFRAFMENLERDGTEDDLTDPTLGLAFPKEAILARNARRIADLYDSANNPTEAAKVRAEARALYATALETVKNPEIKAVIETESRELPAE